MNRYHGHDISTEILATQNITEVKAKAAEAVTELSYLKQKVEMLISVTEALWEILKQATESNDDVLKDIVKQVEEKVDIPNNCPKCGQVLQKNIPKCIYCGTENNITDVFDKLR